MGVGGPDPRVSPGVIIKRKNVGIPCPLAVEAFAAHLSYICKYDDKYSRSVTAARAPSSCRPRPPPRPPAPRWEPPRRHRRG